EEPSHAVDEARLRRCVERFRASVGRTPEGKPIVPVVDSEPRAAPLTRPVTPPPALPVAVIPRVPPLRRPWRDRATTFVLPTRYYAAAAAACAISISAALAPVP